MKNNPKPLTGKNGSISKENGAKPKPHEIIIAKALAVAGYNKRFVPSNSVIGMTDCYIKNIHDKSIQNFLVKRLRLRHGISRLIFVNRERKVIDINMLLR